LGASLVAISPQLAQYGRAVRRRAKLEFDVLTDLHLRVAEAYRLAFTLPTDLKELYAAFGNTLDKFRDEPDFRLPMSARYVVDQDRRIRAADVNPDYTIRPEPRTPLRSSASSRQRDRRWPATKGGVREDGTAVRYPLVLGCCE
jgi:peroxiredoxin